MYPSDTTRSLYYSISFNQDKMLLYSLVGITQIILDLYNTQSLSIKIICCCILYSIFITCLYPPPTSFCLYPPSFCLYPSIQVSYKIYYFHQYFHYLGCKKRKSNFSPSIFQNLGQFFPLPPPRE